MTTTSATNALSRARSAYLRSALHQPVQWNEWGAEAFAQAEHEDKPVLLDIGAVWCHWCHVMDRESYEDARLAAVINEHFVAVKVDRDERPDVDARYQAAVQAISGQGGWPLTAILTPDGRPFFGGTYFPREDRYGRPGFERVLLTMAQAWKTRRDEVLESAGSVIAAIEHNESFAGKSGHLSASLAAKLVASAVQQFDPRYGGFGSQPKFPHPSALDMLIDTATRTGDEAAKQAAVVTLRQMARGGMYDQLGGGFHRYSVDERWVVPHFEKMLYDNAALLKNYVHAFQSFVEPEFAAVAGDTVRWMDAWLSDRERGGFYASQDADMTLDDDGDYFTWTREESAEVLNADELAVAAEYYDIGPVGDMHHNPAKNVLHVRHSLEAVAQILRIDASAAATLLESAKAKLYESRCLRATPFIDKTIYTNWNAMAISAYLEAAQVLRVTGTKEFALKTLDRILREAWSDASGLAHVVAYDHGDDAGHRIAGMLDDYALLGHACLDAWERTGELSYFTAASKITEQMVIRFYDHTSLGFFDAEQNGSIDSKLGALSARRKPLQDSPTPAGDPAAAWLLLRIHDLTGENALGEMAEDTLESFAGIVEHFGLYAGTYQLALQRFLLPTVQVVVIGDSAADELEAAATARYAVNKSVIRLTHEQATVENLPPTLAETIPHLPQLHTNTPIAVVCRGLQCLPPVSTPEDLLSALGEY
jgi:uncharacterized protein YyaL (SSP411 family)